MRAVQDRLILILCSLAWILSFSLLRAEDLRLTLPPVLYAVSGLPMSIYFDNIVLTEDPEAYQFEAECGLGTSDVRRWTLTAMDQDVGDHPLAIRVKDAQGQVVAHGSVTVRVTRHDAGDSRAFNILMVGDSLTNASYYPNELAGLCAAPGNPALTFLGTHKPAGAAPSVAHEGYGGWKWAAFLTKFDAKTQGVTAGPLAPKTSSPFIFPGAQGKPAFNLDRYFQESCGGKRPEVVTFLLGINDCFGASPDYAEAQLTQIDTVLDSADQLLAKFHQAVPGAALAVGLTTPPNSRESGFEANYHGKYHRWGWKRIQHRLVERMIERLSGREAEQIYIVPTELNLDPAGGYPENNGVHPNPEGYAQIGASFYAWLKAWAATQP